MQNVVLEGRHVRLEPLDEQHRDGLRAAADDERIWAQPFDTRREAALGSAIVIVPRVATSAPFGRASASFSTSVAVFATDAQGNSGLLSNPLTFVV